MLTHPFALANKLFFMSLIFKAFLSAKTDVGLAKCVQKKGFHTFTQKWDLLLLNLCIKDELQVTI